MFVVCLQVQVQQKTPGKDAKKPESDAKKPDSDTKKSESDVVVVSKATTTEHAETAQKPSFEFTSATTTVNTVKSTSAATKAKPKKPPGETAHKKIGAGKQPRRPKSRIAAKFGAPIE